MKSIRQTLGLALASLGAFSFLIGCKQEESAVPAPAASVFEGSIDPAYVGYWATASKGSTLELKADGKAEMVNIAPGRGTSTAKGDWKVSDGNLLIKIDAGISRYVAKVDGSKLHLTQKSTHLDVEYVKAKP